MVPMARQSRAVELQWEGPTDLPMSVLTTVPGEPAGGSKVKTSVARANSVAKRLASSATPTAAITRMFTMLDWLRRVEDRDIASAAWTEAYRDAEARDWRFMSIELLLLGVFRAGGVAADVLAALGVSDASLSDAVPDHPQWRQSGPPGPRTAVKETPETRYAIGRANGLALAHGETETSAHLLLALLYDPRGATVHLLTGLGVQPRGVLEGLRQRGIRIPPVALQPAAEPTFVVRVSLPRPHATLVIDALDAFLIEGHLERVIDERGIGRWGYGVDPHEPARTRIFADSVVRLPEVVSMALATAGLPQPPAEAWEALPAQ